MMSSLCLFQKWRPLSMSINREKVCSSLSIMASIRDMQSLWDPFCSGLKNSRNPLIGCTLLMTLWRLQLFRSTTQLTKICRQWSRNRNLTAGKRKTSYTMTWPTSTKASKTQPSFADLTTTMRTINYSSFSDLVHSTYNATSIASSWSWCYRSMPGRSWSRSTCGCPTTPTSSPQATNRTCGCCGNTQWSWCATTTRSSTTWTTPKRSSLASICRPPTRLSSPESQGSSGAASPMSIHSWVEAARARAPSYTASWRCSRPTPRRSKWSARRLPRSCWLASIRRRPIMSASSSRSRRNIGRRSWSNSSPFSRISSIFWMPPISRLLGAAEKRSWCGLNMWIRLTRKSNRLWRKPWKTVWWNCTE